MTLRTTKQFSAVLLATLLVTPELLAVNPGPAPADKPADTTATTPADKPVDKLAELFGDPVIAKGKNLEIKRSQLDSAMTGIKAASAARGQVMPPQQVRLLEQQILQRLIQIQLLANMATDADKAKGKELAEKQYDVVLKRAGSEEAISRQLKSVGMTEEELRRRMIQEATAGVVAERVLKITISDEEVKKFYDENPANFEQPEMALVHHILLNTRDPQTRQPLSDEKSAAKRKQADDLLKRARAGEDFVKLAREFSDDPAAKQNGGELKFPRTSPGIPAEFESAAFSLSTNQISDVVTSVMGYHIIKLDEKIPARKLELAKVSNDLKEGLKRRELEKQLPQYMEQVKKENDVQILEEDLMPKEGAFAPDAEALQPKKDDEKK